MKKENEIKKTKNEENINTRHTLSHTNFVPTELRLNLINFNINRN